MHNLYMSHYTHSSNQASEHLHTNWNTAHTQSEADGVVVDRTDTCDLFSLGRVFFLDIVNIAI